MQMDPTQHLSCAYVTTDALPAQLKRQSVTMVSKLDTDYAANLPVPADTLYSMKHLRQISAEQILAFTA